MRLWTLHPKHLDPAGLVALWREALLAQAVLRGNTRGYRHHPQLLRFRSSPEPQGAISAYLRAVLAEAGERGYRFNEGLIIGEPTAARIVETEGQLRYEWAHLGAKLALRNPSWRESHYVGREPSAHPLFMLEAGPVRPWERVDTTLQDSDNEYGSSARLLYCEKLLGLRRDCQIGGCREWENSTGWLLHYSVGRSWYVELECPVHGRGGTWRPEWQPLIEEVLEIKAKEGFDIAGELQALREVHRASDT
jgi:hypothetical protein